MRLCLCAKKREVSSLPIVVLEISGFVYSKNSIAETTPGKRHKDEQFDHYKTTSLSYFVLLIFLLKIFLVSICEKFFFGFFTIIMINNLKHIQRLSESH